MFQSNKRVASLFVLLLAMFSFASKRLIVRAFTTSSTTRRVQPAVFRYAQTFTTRAEATVEEDLDAALEDILGDDTLASFDATSAVNGIDASTDAGTHIEGSHPIPKALVEKVRVVVFSEFA